MSPEGFRQIGEFLTVGLLLSCVSPQRPHQRIESAEPKRFKVLGSGIVDDDEIFSFLISLRLQCAEHLIKKSAVTSTRLTGMRKLFYFSNQSQITPITQVRKYQQQRHKFVGRGVKSLKPFHSVVTLQGAVLWTPY